MENNPKFKFYFLEKYLNTILQKIKLITILLFVGVFTVHANTIVDPQKETLKPEVISGSKKNTEAIRKRVTGRIVDEKGESIIGATVMVNGSTIGTITNPDGLFSIELPEDSKLLTVSYIGYDSQEVLIGSQTNYKVILKDASIRIDEVVVVGYGTQKKESIVGAISQVSSEALITSGTGNITNAIAGKLSGVLTMQQSGQPGSNDSEIIIRGLSSWNGSQPLVLVDGVERDFTNLDPNEINTISVLKDASATAVFGAKGANGVIIVTTKRGTIGKPKLSFTANTGIQIPTKLPKHISSYTTMSALNVALMNRGFFQNLTSQNELDEYQNPSTRLNSLRYPNTDWFDMFTKPFAPTQQANINISGGTKFVKYFASFGYLHEGDFFEGYKDGYVDTHYKNDKINYRTNLDFAITPTTDISFNIGGDIQTVNGHSAVPWQFLYGSSPAAYAPYFPEWVLDEVPDPDYPDERGIRYSSNTGQYFNNPYNIFYSGSFNKRLTSKLFTDILFSQKLDFITQGLVFKAKASLSTSYQNLALTADYDFPEYTLNYDKIGVEGVNPWIRDQEGNEVYKQGPLDVNIGGMTGGYYTNLYYEFATKYNRTFGKHSVSGLALINYQQKNSGSEFAYYNAGVVGRATYDYDGKYLFEMNLGYTGSERFAPENRFGIFPAIAVGWIASEEKFFKSAFPIIDKLKFRYSDGLVGSDNATSRWLYISNYSENGKIITEDKAANSVSQWEQARKRDFGLEMGIFKNQLRFSFDIYDEFRDRMLLTPNSITFFVGNSFKDLNLGSVKKHGFEVEAEFNKTTKNKFNYFIKGNLGFNETRIIFKDDLPYSDDYQKQAGKALGAQVEGLQLNGDEYFTTVDDLHINPIPININDANVGDYQYLDYDANGVINLNDGHPIQGNRYPPLTYSFSGGLSFKGFVFNMMFQGNSGKYVNYNSAFEVEFLKSNLRIHESQLDYWSPTNPNANHATLNYEFTKLGWAEGNAEDGLNSMIEGRFWRNADYLRLKEVYMGYNINSKSIKDATGVSNILVYASGNNVLTFSNLLEGDPERKDFLIGFYPQMISFQLGLKFSF